MRAGKLRNRITIQAPTRTTNDLGEQVITWTDLKDSWAEITPVNSAESSPSPQTQLITSYKIYLRYDADFQSDYRIKYEKGGNTIYFFPFGIRNLDERDRTLEILCRQGGQVNG